MSSRWGPRVPQEVPEGAAPDPTEVEFITDVEWANTSDRLATGELAPKPKSVSTDPCGCLATNDGMPCCIDETCVLFACLEECPAQCSAGKACKNRRIAKKEWKNVEIFDAGPKGRGLRALEGIQRGEYIIEYVGRAIRKAYLEKLFSRYKNERMLYIMALDTDVYLDARVKGGKARFINHSCEPNCVVDRWKVNGILRAAIFATKEINEGEELSFDYQWERKRGRAPTKCHCGAPSCRGMLEMPKSMEEEEEERKLMGHWKKTTSKNVGKEIVNRSIRIMSEEHHEWFSADVVKYDESNGKHLVMYRANLEEVWENLMKEDWMILDEDAEQFVIAKKSVRPRSFQLSSSLIGASVLGGNHERLQSDVKNFLFIQTPIKCGFLKHGLFDRCQRTVGVVIEFERVIQTGTDLKTDEDLEREQAFSESKDGFVWKVSVSGNGHEAISHALFILTKNVVFLHNKYDIEMPTSVASNIPKKQVSELSEEVIIPRVIVEHIKRKMPLIRELCRNVTVTFAPSESKSKKFSKLLMEANIESDLTAAKGQLWPQLIASCVEVQADFNSFGAHKDLGFFGGELSSEQFKLLVGLQVDFNLSQECNEDLRKSSFFNAFQNTQRCTVWVQTEGDIGRIDRQTLSVSEAIPNAPRKIYFGCDPKDVPKVWGLVETRASDLARGVRYFHLGADRIYQQFMMRKSGQFFDYIQQLTGASVQTDLMTGDHLRIDGRTSGNELIQIGDWDSEITLKESEQAALAEELIKLQIKLYRDHCTRHEGWIFGRDWTLANCVEKHAKAETSSPPRATSTNPRGPSVQSNRSQFESRNVSAACMEIEDINGNMELEGMVAAHAVVILYRFLHVIGENEALGTNSKLRELLLASLFLANKAQKVTKWKRMESLLEGAYKSFYPGTRFDKDNEEVAILENRVIQVETEILEVLDFDIFWSGMDWVLRAAIEDGRLAEPLAKNVFESTLSGPVLAAGSEVWLSFGPNYVFAAIAGFLSFPLEPLFSALSLIPYKVIVVAEKILDSIIASSTSKRTSSISIFNSGKACLVNCLEQMKQDCMNSMSTTSQPGLIPHNNLSEVGARYMLIGQRDSQRQIFQGVSSLVIQDLIVPVIDGMSAESKCKIIVGENEIGGFEDIMLEGSWRALAIAEYLLRNVCIEHGVLPSPIDSFTAKEDAIYRVQSKREPGLLSMSAIHTSDGWDGTIQSKLLNETGSLGRKVGGKACVAGKISEGALRNVGLRWWIPPRYGPSPTASICDMFTIRSPVDGELKRMRDLKALTDLSMYLVGEAATATNFPVLFSLSSKGTKYDHADRCVAVSMQRWPSEKVSSKEQGKSSSKQSQLGYSPAALQEMQLLTQLHSLIPSAHGHPNFILPVAVALPQDTSSTTHEKPEETTFGQSQNDIFSLFQTSEQNERRKEKEKRRKDMATGPHLVFHPTPFVLQRVISRSKKHRDDSESVISSPILSAWFHDMLSAVVHCHTNHVILRAIHADQVFLDDSGVAKLSGLYRATILPPNERSTSINPLRNARSVKREKGRDRQDDGSEIASNPYVSPENLLGSMKHTKETDIWSIGCLMANILLGKPLFVGKERIALLMAMFKIVGTPGKDNFPDASRFPFYKDSPKKYKRGVQKAFQHMMKESDYNEHEKAIDLIAAMVHLDPCKRISAVDALKHVYMIQYVEDCATKHFRKQFVQDWISLKERLVCGSKSEDDDAQLKDQSAKRSAMILATKVSVLGDDVDDLYDMDDIISGQAEKKTKLSHGFGRVS